MLPFVGIVSAREHGTARYTAQCQQHGAKAHGAKVDYDEPGQMLPRGLQLN